MLSQDRSSTQKALLQIHPGLHGALLPVFHHLGHLFTPGSPPACASPCVTRYLSLAMLDVTCRGRSFASLLHQEESKEDTRNSSILSLIRISDQTISKGFVHPGCRSIIGVPVSFANLTQTETPGGRELQLRNCSSDWPVVLTDAVRDPSPLWVEPPWQVVLYCVRAV